eukprot:9140180-Pyramimonas_sp.AAC.1
MAGSRHRSRQRDYWITSTAQHTRKARLEFWKLPGGVGGLEGAGHDDIGADANPRRGARLR